MSAVPNPELAAALREPEVLAHGASAGWAAWIAARLGDQELVIVVAPDEMAARRIEDEVRFWRGETEDVAALPAIDVSPYADMSPDRTSLVERMGTLYRLATPALRPRVVVTSAEALVRRTLPPAELVQRGMTIAVGDTIDREAVTALLVAGGWTRTPVVDEAGTFAVRGGVIDVFAPLARYPVRIELFGDDVESLRTFDPDSQRTLRTVERLELHPVRETIATGTSEVRARIRAYADEIAFPSKATRQVIEQVESGEVFVGIEGLTPAFHDELVAPAAYVPADARWIVIDPDACRRTITDVWIDAEARYRERVASATSKDRSLAYPPDRHFVDADGAGLGGAGGRRRLMLPTLAVEGTPGTHVRVDIDNLSVLKQELDHARSFGDTEHAQPLVTAIARWRRDGLRVVIACDSQSRIDRLHGVLAARGVELRLPPPGERPARDHTDSRSRRHRSAHRWC